MKAAVASDTGDLDNLMACFKTAHKRDAAALARFRYPLTFGDLDNILRAGVRRQRVVLKFLNPPLRPGGFVF